ncbi:MAG: transketolase C-terminal domain-containing protein [Elusimicrobiota bacterium]|jgi:transketolase
MTLSAASKKQTVDVIEMLRVEAERLRLLNLKALNRAGSGHPGGTLSLAEVMATLFFGGVLRYDPQDPAWTHRDRLVLSEGHSVPILYSALVEANVKGWSLEALMDLRKNPDAIAQGHATRGTPGIDVSTGALGMGGSKSLGLALAARYKGQDYHTFAIIGDGEMEEGEIYEAASNAALVGADNLTWILNRNKAQQTAGICDVSHIDHARWFESMGWKVVLLNGESSEPAQNRDFISQLRAALLQAKKDAHLAGRPTLILIDTIKGKGVDFMEFRDHKPGEYKFHGVSPTNEQLARAIPIIEARLGSPDTQELPAFLKQGAVSAEIRRDVDERNQRAMAEQRLKHEELRRKAHVVFPSYKTTDKPTGTRVGFGAALASLAVQHPEVVATSPDLQDSVQMFDLEKMVGRHTPDNPLGAYFPEGISESNACGKCAGLGYEGLIPFIGTFDNFLLEGADELQHASAFGSFYVAVGTHSGCGVGPDGKSQMGLGTPGMIDHFSGVDGELFEMFEPCDAQEAAEITRLIVDRYFKEGNPGHPIYLRCTRHNVPHLDRSGLTDYPRKLLEGSYVIPSSAAGKSDILLVASGATVSEAVKAQAQLAQQGIKATVINVVSLNKIHRPNSTFVKDYLENDVPLLTVHDAEPNALGHRVKDAVNTARLLGRRPGIVMRCLGADPSPRAAHIGSGTTEENYRRNHLDAAGIVETVKQILKK